ncbi:MAG: peptide deformylase [Pseudomonadota bacterium]
MAIRKIARMGHEVLKKVCEPVADPSAPAIARLAEDLIETCEDIGGNGIAAPQVYEPVRMFVYRVRNSVMPPGASMQPIPWTVVINPVITPLSPDTRPYWERCLSLPGLYGQVRRPVHIRMQWFDLAGHAHTITAYRFHARLLQHEADHLDGVLYPMRMDDMGTLGFVSELAPPAYPTFPLTPEDFVDPEPG